MDYKKIVKSATKIGYYSNSDKVLEQLPSYDIIKELDDLNTMKVMEIMLNNNMFPKADEVIVTFISSTIVSLKYNIPKASAAGTVRTMLYELKHLVVYVDSISEQLADYKMDMSRYLKTKAANF